MFTLLTFLDIDLAIGIIDASPWSENSEGLTVVNKLKSLRQNNKIVFGFTTSFDSAGEWRYYEGMIVIDLNSIGHRAFALYRLSALLVHEGTHAAFGHEGITFAQERRAFDNAYHFEISLYGAKALPYFPVWTPDSFIEERYHVNAPVN
ncbi:MAG: hypothetical protein HY349_08090 [Nitrospirae bacterium]|nr:hypothetical protein [Nitrospirota bacterium]